MPGKPDLAALRQQIDAIDEAMHRLLIERGTVISGIAAAKQDAETGSAFRPEREASMMRALAARHDGGLPLAAVEHIWREIIGTFTQKQAAFRVHVAEGEKPAMRDMARFYFGFATPLVSHADPNGALDALEADLDDLALLPMTAVTPWWRRLGGGLKIIARYPFFDFPPGIVPAPVLVVGDARIEPPSGPGVFVLECAGDADPAAMAGDAATVLLQAATPEGRSVLLSSELDGDKLAIAMGLEGEAAGRLRAVGGYAKAAAAGEAS
ncbi:MAG: chorismate mutase [Flavobacteriaceae bacterium]